MFIKLNFNHRTLRLALCIVFSFSWTHLDLRLSTSGASSKAELPTLSLKTVQAKKSRSYKAKKKTKKKRSKSRSVKKTRVKTRSKRRTKRKRKSSRRPTGVKSLWRKDGLKQNSKQRWKRTGAMVRQGARSHGTRSRFKPKYRRQSRRGTLRYQRNTLRSDTSSSSTSHFQGTSQQSSGFVQQDSASSSSIPPQVSRPGQQDLAREAPSGFNSKPSLMLLSSSWIDALELELSSTMWDFNSPLAKSDDDDWSAAEAKANYQISPQIMYRGQLRLYSRFIDLDINYESKAGLSVLSEQGTWLDLAFALPGLIPALAPLSLSYRRVRFADGQVDLINYDSGPVERQKFEMYVDRYEARWLMLEGPQQTASASSQISLFFAYDQRALPRHIYLEERVRIDDENSYSIYYGISDQLLWTPVDSYDLGADLKIGLSSSLQVNLALSLGLGSYELLSPLAGELFDKGSLAVLGFKAGVNYEIPLAGFMSLKASYQVQGRAFSPNGLSDRLEQDLSEEALNLDDLHLSFGSVDLLHRVGLSLVLRLAERSP